MASEAAAAAMREGEGKCGGVATSLEALATASGAAGVSSSPGLTRVYMGGLSGGVTEADIEKTLAPLGRVSRVEFVRTKGRALAFMDFEPKSDKSLAKLFTTYNGCVWKGGRLRLEKAKEHYLDRLNREWAEDAETTKKPMVMDMSKGLISSEKSKCTAKEKMGLRIFFHKLRKVKVLPFKGTGKHKYSFQRVVAPSLPTHFCDCEEHYQSPEDSNRNQLNYTKDQTTVVNREELIIMNSVMNKLLEKDANTNDADDEAFSAIRKDILDDLNNETQCGDGEAAQQLEADADNFVTNIGLGDGKDVLNLMQLKGWDATSENQELEFRKQQTFHDQVISEKQNTWKRQITRSETVFEEPCGKRARLPSETSKNSKLSSLVAGNIRNEETEEHQVWNDLSAIQSQGSNYGERPDIIKSKTTQNFTLGQSVSGTSWTQKSSWKDLVGDSGSRTFTISHVLPGVKSSTARLSKPSGADVRSSAEETAKPQPEHSYSKPVEHLENNIPVEKIVAPRQEGRSSEGGIYIIGEGGRDEAPTSRSINQEPKTDAAKIGVGHVCSFMRSADSVKEWTKAKAALSGHLKKKKKKKRENEAYVGTKIISPRR